MILLKHIRECEGRADAEGGDRGSSLLFSKKDVREIEFTYIRQKQHTHKAFTGRFTLHLPPPPDTHCIPFREPGLPQGAPGRPTHICQMLHASVEDKPKCTNPSVYLFDVHRYL